jgi:hypothetical protein
VRRFVGVQPRQGAGKILDCVATKWLSGIDPAFGAGRSVKQVPARPDNSPDERAKYKRLAHGRLAMRKSSA